MRLFQRWATASVLGVVAAMLMVAAVVAAPLLSSFTQTELDTNWEADRRFPTGGVISETAFGRTNVAHLGIDSSATSAGGFYRTEGIKTVGAQDFGDSVQVDLYLDPAWEDNAVRAGLWVVGDDGSGARDELFGIIEFVHSEYCDVEDCSTHPTNRPDHEGFRIWDSNIGWSEELTTAFAYGDWVTLTISLDATAGLYTYAIDGQVVGTATGGENFIREVFLNSYNYGLDNFPTLNSNSYAAHWHAGLPQPANKDECKKNGWKGLFRADGSTFKNQGDCIQYVNTGK